MEGGREDGGMKEGERMEGGGRETIRIQKCERERGIWEKELERYEGLQQKIRG